MLNLLMDFLGAYIGLGILFVVASALAMKKWPGGFVADSLGGQYAEWQEVLLGIVAWPVAVFCVVQDWLDGRP